MPILEYGVSLSDIPAWRKRRPKAYTKYISFSYCLPFPYRPSTSRQLAYAENVKYINTFIMPSWCWLALHFFFTNRHYWRFLYFFFWHIFLCVISYFSKNHSSFHMPLFTTRPTSIIGVYIKLFVYWMIQELKIVLHNVFM